MGLFEAPDAEESEADYPESSLPDDGLEELRTSAPARDSDACSQQVASGCWRRISAALRPKG